MHTYCFRVHVQNVGVIEETVSAYTPLDAQHLIEARYAPSKVTVHTFRQIS